MEKELKQYRIVAYMNMTLKTSGMIKEKEQ